MAATESLQSRPAGRGELEKGPKRLFHSEVTASTCPTAACPARSCGSTGAYRKRLRHRQAQIRPAGPRHLPRGGHLADREPGCKGR